MSSSPKSVPPLEYIECAEGAGPAVRVHAPALGVQLHLAPGVGLLPQLTEDLDALGDARRAYWMSEAHQTARGVGGKLAAEVEDALLHELSALAFLAEAEVLVGHQLSPGVRIVDLEAVEVLTRVLDTRHGVSLLRRRALAAEMRDPRVGMRPIGHPHEVRATPGTR